MPFDGGGRSTLRGAADQVEAGARVLGEDGSGTLLDQ